MRRVHELCLARKYLDREGKIALNKRTLVANPNFDRFLRAIQGSNPIKKRWGQWSGYVQYPDYVRIQHSVMGLDFLFFPPFFHEIAISSPAPLSLEPG